MAPSISIHDIAVDAIAYGLWGILLFLSSLAVFIGFRVVRTSETGDRRRYLLAGFMIVVPPVLFAVVARALVWTHAWSGYPGIGRNEGELIAIFGNLLAAMCCSASAAFVLPARSPRERGFAIVGGALAGFAIYCIASGPK
jgi:hypothetical protein